MVVEDRTMVLAPTELAIDFESAFVHTLTPWTEALHASFIVLHQLDLLLICHVVEKVPTKVEPMHTVTGRTWWITGLVEQWNLFYVWPFS